MKTRLLFLLLFIGLGLVSCDNNDERFFLYEIDDIYFPDQPISDIVMEITDGAAVGMTGGVAPYTVETGDEEIAKAKIQEECDDSSRSIGNNISCSERCEWTDC